VAEQSDAAIAAVVARGDIDELADYCRLLLRGFEWAVVRCAEEPPADLKSLVDAARAYLVSEHVV
jgi:hypothetical protein